MIAVLLTATTSFNVGMYLDTCEPIRFKPVTIDATALCILILVFSDVENDSG